MNNEGELDIAYDISCNDDLSVLSVFKTENGQIKMIKAFIGEKAENIYKLLTEKGGEYEQRSHGECKTCKHYVPYKEQFSYRNRGDGYCKSAITNSEGEAYINCSDEWYCANYEKEGDAK